MTEADLQTGLAVAAAAGGVGYGIALVLQLLSRNRPALAVGLPVAVGVILKIGATLAVSLTSFGSTIRGPDEQGVLENARVLAQGSLLSGAGLDALTSKLYLWVAAAEARVFDFPDDAIRIVQVGIASVGLLLLIAAVYDLAGARAASIAAWILAFEPSTTFFSGLVHKESLMLLAIGLVSLGSVRLWRDLDVRSLPLLFAGFAVGIATRPYAGWFLVGSTTALAIHSAFRRRKPARYAPIFLGLVAAAVVLIAVPTLANISSSQSLGRLQLSQTANTSGSEANLRLEPVDYSSRAGVVVSLPRRIRDVLLRPYPWQVENTSQRLGLLGTTVAVGLLFYLLFLMVQNAGRVMERAAPLLYPSAFLLAAYALSSGNAGTSFRYRAQLVALGICIITVLRESRRPEPAPSQAERPIGYAVVAR